MKYPQNFTPLLTKSKGFTIVEILVALAIVLVITGMGLPAFTSFNKRQAVKKVGSELRDNARLVQNRAISGEKRCTCGNPPTDKDYLLSGWYLQFNLILDNKSYNIDSKCKLNPDVGSYVCATGPINNVDPKIIALKSTTGISGIDLQKADGTSVASPQKIYILFSPTTNSVKFYGDISTELPDYTASADRVVITLQDTSDVTMLYKVVITSKGNIYEIQ